MFGVRRLGFRVIHHLPVFAFALFVVEYIISMCGSWQRACFLLRSIHGYIFFSFDGHHGSRLRFFGSGGLSAGVVSSLLCLVWGRRGFVPSPVETL